MPVFKKMRGRKRHTQEIISHTAELYRPRKFWMPQDFSADGVVPHALLVDADFPCSCVDFDDTRRETLLELLGQMRGDRFLDFDMGQQAV